MHDRRCPRHTEKAYPVIVRGWLMIGGPETAAKLPPHLNMGTFAAGHPDSSSCEPGQWVLWSPVSGAYPVCLVCVEVPVG